MAGFAVRLSKNRQLSEVFDNFKLATSSILVVGPVSPVTVQNLTESTGAFSQHREVAAGWCHYHATICTVFII